MDLSRHTKAELIAIIEKDTGTVRRARRALQDVKDAHDEIARLRVELDSVRAATRRAQEQAEAMAAELRRAQQAIRTVEVVREVVRTVEKPVEVVREVVAYRKPPDYQAMKARLAELEATLAGDR